MAGCLEPYRYGTAFIHCRKCGHAIRRGQASPDYIGTTEPNEKGEVYRYYHCPNCATVVKQKIA